MTAGPGLATFTLDWDPPAHDDEVTKYLIHRAINNNDPSPIAEVDAAQTSYGDSWLPDVSWAPLGAYTYSVTAVNFVGESPSSNQVFCAPLHSVVPVSVPLVSINPPCLSGEQ